MKSMLLSRWSRQRRGYNQTRTEELQSVTQKIGAAVYQQQAGPGVGDTGPAGSPGEPPGPSGEDVVDGEFRNV
jgi:hypothetical protein